MTKAKYIALCAVILAALVIGGTVAQAQVVAYLPATISAALAAAGWYAVGVGIAVIAGGYLVYHVSTSVYYYYKAYTYTRVSDHAYTLHAYDFPWIWSSKPPKSTFDSKCKSNMNSKTSEKYIQAYDKRLISYNPSNLMVSVGDTDGVTVITCFPKSRADVDKKVRTGEWIKVKY